MHLTLQADFVSDNVIIENLNIKVSSRRKMQQKVAFKQILKGAGLQVIYKWNTLSNTLQAPFCRF